MKTATCCGNAIEVKRQFHSFCSHKILFSSVGSFLHTAEVYHVMHCLRHSFYKPSLLKIKDRDLDCEVVQINWVVVQTFRHMLRLKDEE